MSVVSITGIGVHSGLSSTVNIHQDANPTQPIRFYRAGKFIPALVSQVVSTERTTTLGDASGIMRVSLVEHILAALYVANRWSGLVIEVSQEELPILDGSAQPWFELISDLGNKTDAIQPLELTKTYSHEQDGSSISLMPASETTLKAAIDFEHPAIGQQSWSGKPQNFIDLLPARTFVLNEWLEDLNAKGLGLGIQEDNCAILKEDSDLAKLYRFKNEAVMHKALDALGDLFLLGAPFAGALNISRGSHKLHIAFARLVYAELLKSQ